MIELTYNFCHVTCLAHGLNAVHLKHESVSLSHLFMIIMRCTLRYQNKKMRIRLIEFNARNLGTDNTILYYYSIS